MRIFTNKTLACMALLAALEVILARIVPMFGPTLRVSIEAVPIVIAGLLFGPVPGMIVGFVGDAVGTLFSGYGYNPVFAVPPVLIGLCAGLLRPMLYRKVSYLRILAAFAPAMVLGSILWQSYWLAFFYGTRTFAGFLGVRSVQFLFTALADAAVVYGMFRTKVFESLNLWPPERAARSKAGETA